MSIQNSINSKFMNRVFSKLKLVKYYDCFLKLYQYLFREFSYLFISKKNDIRVFFDYYKNYTHPYHKKRFYGKNAPLLWSNLKSSKVVHCIQKSSPRFKGKKIIVEPNDHVLVLGVSLGIHNPSDLVRRSNEINDYIVSSNISKVLVGNNELINHAKYYFSENALKKFFIYPSMACEIKVNEQQLKEKNQSLCGRKIKFLSIASDFKVKAVELLLEAFMDFQILDELTLVCHNVPNYLKSRILKTKNIFLVEDLPLSDKKKKQLYLNSDVYINLTYIDGGTVAVNALEYGLPIITYTYHRGKGFVDNKNGILLSEPMKYYDPLGYGIKWNSMEEYLLKVDILKKKGGYQKVQKELINAVKFYEKEPLEILNQGIKSLEYAKKNSLTVSNQVLRSLYKEVSLEK
jgi:hypothetical protein